MMNKRNKKGCFPKVRHSINVFFISFFEKSGIHGFFYFAQTFLHYLEKLFWLILVIAAFSMCVFISLESYRRYETKGVVVTIEKDHYYWNTTLPSLTICPTQNRIDKELFDEYCEYNRIQDTDKEEFYMFIESLANATYSNFENIKDFPSIDRLNIEPKDYMTLIYSLTEDWSRRSGGERKVRTIRNLEFGISEQVLTEYGICYVTNNYLAYNISTRMLLFGEAPPSIYDDQYYRDHKIHDIIAGNLFDGDMGYNFVGFMDNITIFIHSPYETIDIGKRSFYSDFALEFRCFVNEIVASDKFQSSTRISQRGCRFLPESNLTHYKFYTKGICLQECRLNLAYKMCKCIPHFYPNHNLLVQFRDEKLEEVNCNCQQNCVDANIFIDSFQVLEGTTDLLGSIGGFMLVKQYPLIRYKRKVLFTFEDLLGGTAGLFTGFCVLGAIEIIYFFTLRLFWYIKGRR